MERGRVKGKEGQREGGKGMLSSCRMIRSDAYFALIIGVKKISPSTISIIQCSFAIPYTTYLHQFLPIKQNLSVAKPKKLLVAAFRMLP